MSEPIHTFYVAATGRKVYQCDGLDTYPDQNNAHPYAVTDMARANLVSSEVAPDRHLPVIDCDYGIQAIPSSSPGHYHLYIDKELTWAQYTVLLHGFYGAGLIEKAWYRNALKEKRSYVRLPHVLKPVKK